MKQFYSNICKFISPVIVLLVLVSNPSAAQSCTPLGDQTSYGTGNTWIGYVYQGLNFNTYKGYVNEGNAASPNFDESFGGDQVNYTTNGCSIYTDTFTVRYKLTKNFADANYNITVGGDDGFRLSLDGGATWVINSWTTHSYATSSYNVHLNGSYNMVLEYYENLVNNRLSFALTTVCTGDGDPTVYGTNNTWKAYLYQGMNFDAYKGYVSEGSSSNMNFDESFGGTNTTFVTSNCSVQTEQFSARFRLQRTFATGTYLITVGGDDGYRLSLDGGATWVINKWNDQSYGVTTYSATLSGTYNMVLEYYENGGGNRISFSISGSLLPVTLINWSAALAGLDKVQLNWKTAAAINFNHFILQRSTDGNTFSNIQTIAAKTSNSTEENYNYTDKLSFTGVVYYRLAMVDKDGSTVYSTIAVVSMKSETNVKIYPTVVENGSIFIETGKTYTQGKIELFDMNGRAVLNTNSNFSGTSQQVSLQPVNGSRLTAGSYIVRISANNEVLAKKIIIVK
jgi:Secretion system C-terminal sorting domain